MTAAHPTADTLLAYAHGKADNTVLNEVARHLVHCEECKSRVNSMSGDRFMNQLRDAQRSAAPAAGRASETDSLSETGLPAPTVAMPAAALPPELSSLTHYADVRELGRGGMGVVYLARNTLMSRDEVLKVVNQGMIERAGSANRFLREIRAAAALDHPNVVKAYTVLPLGGVLVLAMEYVPGSNLDVVVESKGPLPVTNACYYAYQVALGLQHAHDRGLVHRDIKPENLMLAKVGGKSVVKILDFGLAKAAGLTDRTNVKLTEEGVGMGTPAYMPPEQIYDAASVDIRADVYSLGCSLYHMLAGRPPFAGESRREVLNAHSTRDAEPLDRVRPEVPAALAAVVAKMMAKKPEDRYQTPAEVGKELLRFFKPAGPAAMPQVLAAKTKGSAAATKPKTVTPQVTPVHVDVAKEPMIIAPKLPAHGGPRWWLLLPVVVLLTAMAGGGYALLRPTDVRVKTANGTVVIENVPADVKVTVDGQLVSVSWGVGARKAVITVKEGRRKVRAVKDGVEFVDVEVTIADGGTVTLRATQPPVPSAAKNAEEKPLSKSERFRKNPAQYLAGTRWRFFCPEDRFIATITLEEGGTVGNAPHAQEARWKIVGEQIVFGREDGSVTSSFSLFSAEDNRLEFRGPFVYNGWVVKLLEVVD